MTAQPLPRMARQTYTVRFVTPAFLGDAEQNGAWRTPPFKALLRQWWRVVVAKTCGYNHAQMREHEGLLFGNAWLKDQFRQSQIKLRLDSWKNGQLTQWPTPDPMITHPEVTNPAGHPRPVGSHLYLGYGPLIFQQGNTKLKANAAIQADDHANLTVIFPHTTALVSILQLIHWFGTLGGRSRNGWGSLALDGQGIEHLTGNHATLQTIARPLTDCLSLDWPHALGSDNNGVLVWRTQQEFGNWRDAMKELAKVKIAFRTALHFSPERHHHIDQRHVLSYPVTNHNFSPWGNQFRLANQLRFKVAKTADNRYQGIIYHLPCGIPNELLNALNTADRNWIVEQQLGVWQTVHQTLNDKMQRLAH